MSAGIRAGSTASRRRIVASLFCMLVGSALWMMLLTSSATALSQRGYVFSRTLSVKGITLSEPKGVAVNETTGEIYVVDSGNNRLDVFNAAGEFQEAWGWGVENGEKKFEKCSTECRKGLAGHHNGQFHGAEAVAVDNDAASPSFGDIYVEAVTPYEEEIEGKESESETAIIDKFSVSGEVLSQIKTYDKGEEIEEPHGLTVTPSGELWIYNEEEIAVFASAVKPKFLKVIPTELEGEARAGIAVEKDGDFYAGHSESAEETEPTVIAQELLLTEEGSSFGEPLNTAVSSENTTGVIVDQANQDVLLDLGTSIGLYNPADELIERFGATEQGQTEILRKGSGMALDPKLEAEGSLLVADATANRLDVFVPEPPTAPRVDEATVQNITATGTEVETAIDPAGETVEYFVRYGREPVPAASAPCVSPCTEVPSPHLTLGAKGQFGDVTPPPLKIEGLAPSTLYHFRVIARSGLGVGESVEAKFKTHPAVLGSALPDDRQWELVSPQEKNGAFIEAQTREGGAIQAAKNGDSVVYVASNALPGAEGNRAPEPDQVYSTRGSGGWDSTNLTTPNNVALGVTPGSAPEYRLFSDDLSESFVQPFGTEPQESPPLSSEAIERTVYRRETARCSGSPSACFTPLVDAANDTGEVTNTKGEKERSQFGGSVEFITANQSGAAAVLSSGVPLTSETAAPGRNLYEWQAGGKLSLVNVLPNNKPVYGAEVGIANKVVRNAVSEDGTRVIFAAEKHLYMRDTQTGKTMQIDKPVGVTEVRGPRGPEFQDATRDDSTIFFTDDAKLTASATPKPEKPDLYVCEVQEVDGEQTCNLSDLSVDSNSNEAANVQGVMPGIDEEHGTDAYFVANGVLAGSPPRGNCVKGLEGREQESEFGEHVLGATCNLYVVRLEDGVWTPPKLIATLSAEDEPDWSIGAPNNLSHVTSRASENGQWLAFMSDRSLTGYDNRDAHSGKADEEVYLYSAAKESLVCASCDPNGARPDGVHDVEESSEGIGLLVDRPLIWTGRWLGANVPGWTRISLNEALYQSRYLTNSGRLFFNTSQKLVPQDQNSTEDVYEYEPGGTLGPANEADCESSFDTYSENADGCVALISGGTPEEKESAFLDASENGDDVFFDTAAQLTGWDKDSSYDVYDARICAEEAGGCIAEPPPAVEQCRELSSCRGPETHSTLSSGPTGSLVPGSGNTDRGEVLGAKEEKPASKPKAKPLTRAQKYAKALKECKRIRNKHKRALCDAQAKKKYGPPAKKGKKSSVKGGRR